jgi:NADPH-dependent curcumin reductase CurA
VVGVVTPPATCMSLRATPRQLTVGKRTTIVARVLLSNGKPFARARVRVTAPGINRTNRTNAQGIARITVKPAKAGIARITVVGSSGCSARSGIVGVFQPPVTG